MTKAELATLVKTVFPSLREWAFRESDLNTFPRALYWGYARSGTRASGLTYSKDETVQISVFSLSPNEVKVDELEYILIEHGFAPEIFIEFNETDRIFHYYLGVQCER
ncbi:hypothetical protein [Alkalibacter mobilis]|uniref:hypothetical protein n=1 Tax=Alkalibacter mobilis TaxID=2787712 RepID=UPI00189E6F95|nr:hypothetical protein [Alkalibacter mobilis]MBF7097579.1 hypothetical protein [Alkalibacter mobilis]